MNKIKIIIVGGGFGGVYTAKYLKPLIKSGFAEVTIINKDNYFLFTPLLHEVATGGLSSTSVVEPIEEILRGMGVNFIQDEVISISTNRKEIATGTKTLSYDYLVISSGAETNYYGTPGARENTFTLKSLSDAISIRRTLLDNCRKASTMKDEDEKTKTLSSIIVGGGPTGVELAAELIEFMHETLCSYYKMCGFSKNHMKVNLVAASKDILPQFPIKLQSIAHKELLNKGVNVMVDTAVTSVESGKITLKNGNSIVANTIIWVAGVKPKLPNMEGVELEKSGRIKIDEYLRVKEDIFALGDVSGTLPMLAQVAVQQGRNVAHNIILTVSDKPLIPFKFTEKGLLVSLGQWYAAGKIFGITLKGPMMWWLWRTIYLFNFHSWRNRVKIATEWTINLFSPRDITEV